MTWRGHRHPWFLRSPGQSLAAGIRHVSVRHVASIWIGVFGLMNLAGCAASDLTGLTDRLPPYSVVVGTPTNVIERSMAFCPEKTEVAEAACVKKGMADAGVSVEGLAAMIPGCRSGQQCVFDYTTADRLGFVAATAATYVVHWRVTLDLRQPGGDVTTIPIVVTQV